MAKTKKQKEALVEDYKEMIDSSTGIIFSDNPGLKANDAVELRKRLAETGAKFHILKNKLFQIASSSLIEDEDLLKGSTTAVFATGDITQVAKILKDFSKELEAALTIKGGILDNTFLDQDKAKELADLPSKEELIAKTIYMFNSPLSGLANVLSGNMRNLVYAVNALREQKQ